VAVVAVAVADTEAAVADESAPVADVGALVADEVAVLVALSVADDALIAGPCRVVMLVVPVGECALDFAVNTVEVVLQGVGVLGMDRLSVIENLSVELRDCTDGEDLYVSRCGLGGLPPVKVLETSNHHHA
jgi:hypothetical protein